MKSPICKFCGQIGLKDMLDSATEEELLERGTMECNCYEAQQYQKRRNQAEKAKLELSSILSHDDNQHNIGACEEVIISLLKQAVDLMPESKIYKISIGVCSGGTVDIKTTASGKISVQRSVTLKQKREVE